MSVSGEHREQHAYDGSELLQWLMIVAIVTSGVAITAGWLYLQW